jgi:hypothetical protein
MFFTDSNVFPLILRGGVAIASKGGEGRQAKLWNAALLDYGKTSLA